MQRNMWSISLTLKCIVNLSQNQTHRKFTMYSMNTSCPFARLQRVPISPMLNPYMAYFAVRRILTKGFFSSLLNPMYLRAKPFAATMRRNLFSGIELRRNCLLMFLVKFSSYETNCDHIMYLNTVFRKNV